MAKDAGMERADMPKQHIKIKKWRKYLTEVFSIFPITSRTKPAVDTDFRMPILRYAPFCFAKRAP